MIRKLTTGLLAATVSGLVIGATTTPVTLLNPAGSTAGQAIVSTGPSTAPAWGNVTATALGPVAGNTVIANATGSSAAPAAVALPSCSTANSALKYTSGTGFSCGTTFALTSGNLSQFAATTSAQLLGVLSDETGSGAAVFGTSPTLTTPTITGGSINNTPIGQTTQAAGSFTNVSATGFINPSQTLGLVGTTTNNNANAGAWGEVITATGTNVSLTTGTPANITSVSLTAGDWEVHGNIQFNPAGTTTIQQVVAGFSTTSVTFQPNINLNMNVAFTTGAIVGGLIPSQRFSLASTTTVYLVGQSSFGVSTMTATGTIRARRVR
ncbi:hypothetical protein [Cupriavidus campinensis]|uniref:hypothetical protein n=1 Tax=Cupriavidus campinensis TaxID=151783 RepID=UPI0024E1ACF6|nr:hypothetical protein [Cupriavidus campinensis]